MPTASLATGDRGSLDSRDLGRLLGGGNGAPAWQWFGGHAFGVVGDLEPLRELFEVEGCTVTVARPDPAGGLHLAARQVTLYRDPGSREVLERWRNPYTGEDIAVVHQHLARIGTTIAAAAAVAPWFATGERASVFLDHHAAVSFPFSSTAAPANAGGRATSCAQLTARRRDLGEAALTSIDYVGAWQLLGDWPEWLAMAARPGYLFQRAFVRKASSREDLPESLRRAILQRFRDGLDPPELS